MTRTTRKRETNIHKNRKTGPKKTSGEIKGRTGVKQGIKKKVERVRTEKGVEDGVETKKRGERGMQSSQHTLYYIPLSFKNSYSQYLDQAQCIKFSVTICLFTLKSKNTYSNQNRDYSSNVWGW